MNSTSSPDGGSVCAANPFVEGFRFQSSQPHLKRFIMFDQSGGKGRVFFHPALAQELFGPAAQNCESYSATQVKEPSKQSTNLKQLKAAESDLKFKAYREIVAGAFASMQKLRSSRQCEVTFMEQMVPETPMSLGNPRVSGSIATAQNLKALEAQAMAQSPMASETLAWFGKPKDSATLPSPESFRVSEILASSEFLPVPIRSQLSGTKWPAETTASESLRENTEDLDALLSSDEEDDEDVRSTGHSPDDSTGKEESCSGDEDDEVQQYSSKRRRVDEQQPEESLKEVSSGEEVNDKRSVQHHYHAGQSNRKQKIKRNVRALRRMIPGGDFLDAALFWDEAILYVKTLRDRVNQLEATRFQTHP